MLEPIPIALYGLGPIGSLVALMAAERPGLRIVAAVDIDPEKAGRPLFEVVSKQLQGVRWQPAGPPPPQSEAVGVVVSADARAALAEGRPRVVLHSTGSSLEGVAPQIEGILDAGAHVISTCEELAYPWRRYPDLARRLDERAKSRGVTVLGVGINPGFIMDVALLTLSGVCRSVERLEARRTVDASERRLPLQRKIGAGLTPEEFGARLKEGTVRHVGLTESVWLLADALGWELDDVSEEAEGVPAAFEVVTPFLRVPPGRMAGIRQVAVGLIGGVERIRLELRMYVGASNPGDRLVIVGDPSLNCEILGVHGDTSTAAIVVNAARSVVQGPPGIVTVADLPTLRCGSS